MTMNPPLESEKEEALLLKDVLVELFGSEGNARQKLFSKSVILIFCAAVLSKNNFIIKNSSTPKLLYRLC